MSVPVTMLMSKVLADGRRYYETDHDHRRRIASRGELDDRVIARTSPEMYDLMLKTNLDWLQQLEASK